MFVKKNNNNKNTHSLTHPPARPPTHPHTHTHTLSEIGIYTLTKHKTTNWKQVEFFNLTVDKKKTLSITIQSS